MNIENSKLDQLLNEQFKKEFPLPQKLDRETQLRMSNIAESKQYRFNIILITFSLLITIIGFGVLWHFCSGLYIKIILSYIYSSLLSLSIFFYIINYKLKKEMEV